MRPTLNAETNLDPLLHLGDLSMPPSNPPLSFVTLPFTPVLCSVCVSFHPSFGLIYVHLTAHSWFSSLLLATYLCCFLSLPPCLISVLARLLSSLLSYLSLTQLPSQWAVYPPAPLTSPPAHVSPSNSPLPWFPSCLSTQGIPRVLSFPLNGCATPANPSSPSASLLPGITLSHTPSFPLLFHCFQTLLFLIPLSCPSLHLTVHFHNLWHAISLPSSGGLSHFLSFPLRLPFFLHLHDECM